MLKLEHNASMYYSFTEPRTWCTVLSSLKPYDWQNPSTQKNSQTVWWSASSIRYEYPFLVKIILCSVFPPQTAPAPKDSIERETSIFFYHCPAHHYVFYCWGDERGEEQRRLTVVLPSTDLIGWSHQTTAAVSCGMNKCGAWLCYILGNSWHFIFIATAALSFFFQWERKVSANMHNVFNNKCDSLLIKIDGNTFQAIKSVFNSWQFVSPERKKLFLLNWVQSIKVI